jgi:hypothetical protein
MYARPPTLMRHLPFVFPIVLQQQERSRLGPDARAAGEGEGAAEAAGREDRPQEAYEGRDEADHDYRDDRARPSGERSGGVAGGDRSVDRSRSGVDDRSGAPRSARVPRGSTGTSELARNTYRDPGGRPMPSGSGGSGGRGDREYEDGGEDRSARRDGSGARGQRPLL